MTVRKKTLLIIAATLVFLVLFLYLISKHILLGSFLDLEENNTRLNVERTRAVIFNEIKTLENTARDWAVWDATYDFIESPDLEYIQHNLVDDTFEGLDINLMLFISASGQVVFEKFYDLHWNEGIPVPASLRKHLNVESRLLHYLDTESSVSGIILLPEGPMMISSMPILTSEGRGPTRGSLIMGRFMDSDMIKRFSEITYLPLSLVRLDDLRTLPEIQPSIPSLMIEPIKILPLNSETVAGYTLLRDIYGEPVLVMRVDIPRSIYQQGQAGMVYFILSVIGVGLVFGLIVILLMEKVVLSRLASLSASVACISAGGDLSKRVSLTGTDELATLAGTVNRMLEALEQAQHSLQESGEKYRKLVETIQEGIGMVDSEEKIVYCNAAYAAIFDMEQKDLIGMSLMEFLDEEQQQLIFKQTSIRKQNISSVYELAITTKRGTKKILSVSVTPVIDAEGDYLGAMSAVYDITARKRAEEALRLNEEKFRSLVDDVLDGTDVGIFIVNSDYRIIWLNRAMENYFGIKRVDVIGKDRRQNLQEQIQNILEFPEEYAKKILAAYKNNTYIENFECHVLPGENRAERWLEHWSQPIKTGLYAGGRIEQYYDITGRKRMEEKLEYLSLHDPLTRLSNRTHFEREMQRLGEECHVFAGIILCDVDGLKIINDTLGHGSGDELLAAAARIIKTSLRRGDMVARIGGDEFAILLPDCDRVTVEKTTHRIRDAVSRYNAENPKLPLSMSMGFAACEGDWRSLDDLFKEADNNMYREKLHRSKSARSAIVQAMIKALNARDHITEGHADRLQGLIIRLNTAIGIQENRLADLRLLAKFHDIGKVGIPDRILFKPGSLTSEEMNEMRRHSEIGHRIARSAPGLAPIADWILKHHEWWNGNGYPLGLKGEEIPLECRLLSIIDAYDTMTNDRPYRKAMTSKEALDELRKCSGTQFDPEILEKFIQIIENTDEKTITN